MQQLKNICKYAGAQYAQLAKPNKSINSTLHLDLITIAIKATNQQQYGATRMINKETGQHIIKK
jgi:hypothetical protein